jgi:hypothetical protein
MQPHQHACWAALCVRAAANRPLPPGQARGGSRGDQPPCSWRCGSRARPPQLQGRPSIVCHSKVMLITKNPQVPSHSKESRQCNADARRLRYRVWTVCPHLATAMWRVNSYKPKPACRGVHAADKFERAHTDYPHSSLHLHHADVHLRTPHTLQPHSTCESHHKQLPHTHSGKVRAQPNVLGRPAASRQGNVHVPSRQGQGQGKGQGGACWARGRMLPAPAACTTLAPAAVNDKNVTTSQTQSRQAQLHPMQGPTAPAARPLTHAARKQQRCAMIPLQLRSRVALRTRPANGT